MADYGHSYSVSQYVKERCIADVHRLFFLLAEHLAGQFGGADIDGPHLVVARGVAFQLDQLLPDGVQFLVYLGYLPVCLLHLPSQVDGIGYPYGDYQQAQDAECSSVPFKRPIYMSVCTCLLHLLAAFLFCFND